MCDQSEVSYLPGDVVWVKLGPVWWPAAVCKTEEVPPEIIKNLRKTPIAIVKFFQEDQYEYVQKLSNIYHYNCLKKNDFIKKGLDIFRSKNRDAPSNMKLFPEDVAQAEVLTGGNPDILHDKMFEPEEKPSYADLFPGLKKSPKKPKTEVKKKTPQAVQHQSSPRIITHPRFLKVFNGDNTDYEARERKQEPVRADCDEEDTSQPTTYWCRECNFSTIRLNVIVLHNKSHTRQYNSTPSPSSKAVKRKNVISVKEHLSSTEKSFSEEELVRAKIPKTNSTPSKAGQRGRPRKSVPPETPVSIESEIESQTTNSTLKPKPNKKTENDPFQNSLLEDWNDFEEETIENKKSDVQVKKIEHTKKLLDVKSSEKSCFDFDDSEDQLIIDKSKIKFGRKIPRVIEDKVESAIRDNEIDVDKVAEPAVENEEMEVQKNTECRKEDADGQEKQSDLSKEVDQLLQEISAPTKLPEIPRSVKKEQIKLYNASLAESPTTETEQSVIELNDQNICVDIIKEVVVHEKSIYEAPTEIIEPSTAILEVPLIDETTPVVFQDDIKTMQDVESTTEVAAKSKVPLVSKVDRKMVFSDFCLVQSPTSKQKEIEDKMKSLGVKIGNNQPLVSGNNKRTLVWGKPNTMAKGGQEALITATSAAGRQVLVTTVTAAKEADHLPKSFSNSSTAMQAVPAIKVTFKNSERNNELNNLINENGSEKNDILAKALQDTDVIENDVVPSNVVIDDVLCTGKNDETSENGYGNLTLTNQTIVSL